MPIDRNGQCEDCFQVFDSLPENSECPNTGCPGYKELINSEFVFSAVPEEVSLVLRHMNMINPMVDHVVFTAPSGLHYFFNGKTMESPSLGGDVDQDLIKSALEAVPYLPYCASLN